MPLKPDTTTPDFTNENRIALGYTRRALNEMEVALSALSHRNAFRPVIDLHVQMLERLKTVLEKPDTAEVPSA